MLSAASAPLESNQWTISWEHQDFGSAEAGDAEEDEEPGVLDRVIQLALQPGIGR